MPTDPSAALQLLRLLTAGASTAEIQAVEADPEARDLALRIRSAFDTRRRREAELTALVDTARDLAALRNPSVILEAIVRRARTLLGTDVAYLTLYDADAGDTFMRATDGSVSARFQSVRLSLGDGLGGLVASTHRPYWTADYFADQRFAHTGVIDTAVGAEGLVAICGTPLLVDAQFVGVLFAANRAPRPFSREEVALLGSLAALAAVSILQTRATARTAEALERLSEAHDAVHRHTAGIERAAAAHDRFAELVLAGGGLDDITAALAELTGGWVVLMDETGRRLSRTGPAPAQLPVLEDARRGAGRLVHRHDMWAVTVKAAHEQLGFLVIGGVEDLDDPDRRTIERAGMVTALLLLFERAATDAEQRMRTDLVSDLVGGRGDVAVRQARARGQGLDLGEPHVVLVVRGHAEASRRALVMSAHAAVGEPALVGEHDGDVVVLVPGTDAQECAAVVAARMSRSAEVTVGAAGPVTSVEDIPAAHADARRTTTALLALGRSGTGGSAESLGFAGLVSGSAPVGAYVAHSLGPVLDYDRARGTDLLGTLEAYFAAGGSPRHAATQLHVHVNTVAQRLERIGSLLGTGWQGPEQSLELQLALRLRRLMPD